MTWWSWVVQFESAAREKRDTERLRLVSLYRQGFGLSERNPAGYLALYTEGKRLAQQLGEGWWVLCFSNSILQLFVHFSRDFRRALDLAVAAVVDVSKPGQEGCPWRSQIYLDFLAVHFNTDPEGYAERIDEGFREIESILDGDFTSRLHLLNTQRWRFEQARQVEEHHAAAQRALALIAEQPHHYSSEHFSTFIYNGLCRIHFARRQWQELGESADLAEEASRKGNKQVELAEACLWQAVGALHKGEARSSRLRQRGIHLMEALGVPPSDGLFEALASYHELAGQPKAALAVRDRELELLRAQGRTISEVYCHRERCRLLASLGRLTPDDLEAGRGSARRLRFPARHLAEFDGLAGISSPDS
jgi:hypothetical protein